VLATGNYPIVSTDYTIFCENPGGVAKTMTLPSAASNPGKVYVIKRTGASGCEVAGLTAAEGNPYALNAPSPGAISGIVVQSNGTSWWIISTAH
jgi:hypothetical protein